MPSRDPIRTYVPRPEQKGPFRDRTIKPERNNLPLLIKLFVWLLVCRSAVNLLFALIVGFAPDSNAATFIIANFDAWPKQITPEVMFYISALTYGLTAWRWYSKDWRARWVVMFMSGATAAKMLANYVADRATGPPILVPQSQQASFFLSVAINLSICAYLAFYPGMAQAFKETPWD